MIYLNIIFLLLMGSVFILSIRDYRGEKEKLDRKEHKLYFLYPAAWKLITIIKLDQYFYRKTRTLEALRTLERNDRNTASEKLYWCQKVSMVLFVLILCSILSLLGWMSMITGRGNLRDNHLIRPDIGEGDSEIHLKVMLEDKQENKKVIESLNVNLKEREYTQAELEEAFAKGIAYLDERVLGKNEDKDKITENLNFITNLKEIGLRVNWQSEDIKIIGKDGTVHNEELPSMGVDISVTAILSYKSQKKEHRMDFKVLPKPLSDREMLLKDIQTELQVKEEESKTKGRWELPSNIGKYSLSWEEIRQNPVITITLLGILSSIILWFYGDMELQRRLDKRNTQLLLDYPELINKFTLLINAGMTIKQAWVKITGDYIVQLERGSGNHRYAYEEMRRTLRELKLGVPEGDAYEQFGRRAGILPYMRFGTLIAQNLRKGSKGLSDILNKEAMDAFAERKEHAKRLGEEAGTKLLGPMMVMLLIVLIIIIVPAFMSFQI